MEVAVVGAGIVGLTVAHRLVAEGHDVAVIAPSDEPHRASTGNAGTVATYAVDPVGTPDVLRDLPRLLFDRMSPLALHRPSALSLVPWLLRFARRSLPRAAEASRRALAGIVLDADARWRDLASGVGASALLNERGALYAYDSEAAARAGEVSMRRRRALGVVAEPVDARALRVLEPGLPDGRFAGAILFPGAIWFSDPSAMLNQIAAATRAARIGARVAEVRPSGARWEVRHERGTLVADAVVLAAGAWSARLLAPLGLRIPLTAERGYHLEFDGIAPLARPVCPVSRGFYFTPMTGRLRAAGTVELGGIGAPPSAHRWDRLEEAARSVFPELPPPSRRWMGLRPSVPDSLPVVGAVRPGLICAFGHGHIGLTLAPWTAERVAAALVGGAVSETFSPLRF
ncbi:MAG: FAD-binding oxidoreductase [Rhodobacteraceae bacterium]|nr:FAD-binding oxidoreductase [Paracoccaceae bacterium]